MSWWEAGAGQSWGRRLSQKHSLGRDLVWVSGRYTRELKEKAGGPAVGCCKVRGLSHLDQGFGVQVLFGGRSGTKCPIHLYWASGSCVFADQRTSLAAVGAVCSSCPPSAASSACPSCSCLQTFCPFLLNHLCVLQFQVALHSVRVGTCWPFSSECLIPRAALGRKRFRAAAGGRRRRNGRGPML